MNHRTSMTNEMDQRTQRTLWGAVGPILLALLMMVALLGPFAFGEVAWADEEDAVVVTESVVTEDANQLSEEAIQDDETPLSTFDVPHCWTHWIIGLGVAATALYGVVVVRRRLGLSKDADDFQDNILGRAPRSVSRESTQRAVTVHSSL